MYMYHHQFHFQLHFLMFLNLLFVIWLVLKPDLVFEPVTNQLSAETGYYLYEQRSRLTFVETGNLGGFYTCLINYRGLNQRIINIGRVRSFIVKFTYRLMLDISVSGNEAYTVVAIKIDSLGVKERSRPYAINCDLDLLNDRNGIKQIKGSEPDESPRNI